MSKLKGLLLTEGMHGMISQVEGLAKALDIEFAHQKVELNSFWKLIPPNLTPVSKLVFKKIDILDFDIIFDRSSSVAKFPVSLPTVVIEMPFFLRKSIRSFLSELNPPKNKTSISFFHCDF